jgi:hypothetical protein
MTRHISRKHTTQNIQCEEHVQNPNIDVQNPNIDVQNPNIDVQNPINLEQTNTGKVKCIKCTKMLSRTSGLNRHMKICKGVSNPLQCHKCHKIFSSSQSKSIHLKKCEDISTVAVIPEATPATASQVAHTINNNTVNNITNPNYNINIITYNNENILFNSEGICTKDLKIMFNGANKQMIEAIVQYGNKLLEQPENRCVRKKHITSSYCETHSGDGKWETRPDTNVIDRFSQDIAISANDRLYDHPTIGRKELRDEIAELASFPADVHSKAINLRREIRAILVNTSNDVNKN